MPLYGINQAGSNSDLTLNLTAIQPGDRFVLFNAETITAPQASVAFATGYAPGGMGAAPIVFTIDFAAAPTDSLVIQGSNQNVEATYQTLYTSSNTQHDSYADLGNFAFYRCKMVTQSAGGAVTVIAQR